MSYYGVDTDVVQAVGKQVFNLAPEASTAVNGVLSSYTEASSVVHHPLVRAAMTAYHETHQKAHLSLPEAIKALGGNTASGGGTIADATNEASSVFSSSLGTQEGLVRDINTPLR